MMPRIGRYKDLVEKLGTSSGGNEEVFLCPYCITVVGTPDTKGKFYYNLRKRMGFCQRCMSKVFDDSLPEFNEVAEQWLDLLEGRKPEIPDLEDQRFNLSWTMSISDPSCNLHRAYLQRRGIGYDLITRYQLRACTIPFNGIVIPNRILPDGTTDYFQIRDMKEDAWIKYRNPSAEKPLYGVDFAADYLKAMLAEGVFSGISASRVGGFAGLASYGKAIKPEQLAALKKTNFESIYLIYDGGTLGPSISVANQLLRTGKKIYVVFLPYEKDPNDLGVEEIEYCLERSTIHYLDRRIGDYIFRKYQWCTSKYSNRDVVWSKFIRSLHE